nr:hypothetical protein [Tanacetum cinerariifolium]
PVAATNPDHHHHLDAITSAGTSPPRYPYEHRPITITIPTTTTIIIIISTTRHASSLPPNLPPTPRHSTIATR